MVIHDPQGRTEKPFLFPNDLLWGSKGIFNFSRHLDRVECFFLLKKKSVGSQRRVLRIIKLPSLKLLASEKQWLEDDIPFWGKRPILRAYSVASGSVPKFGRIKPSSKFMVTLGDLSLIYCHVWL